MALEVGETAAQAHRFDGNEITKEDLIALAASPYLGSGLEYLEKTPGSAPWLGAIHVFNPAGFASQGLPLGDLPSMRRDIPAAVRRISEDLFLADLDLHEARARADVAPDFGPELYAGGGLLRIRRRITPDSDYFAANCRCNCTSSGERGTRSSCASSASSQSEPCRRRIT
ncbi:hypothetical protein [Cupriavidus necator]